MAVRGFRQPGKSDYGSRRRVYNPYSMNLQVFDVFGVADGGSSAMGSSQIFDFEDGAGSSVGEGVASGVGDSLFSAAGSASGDSVVTGVGISLFEGAGAATGDSVVDGIGSSVVSGNSDGAGEAIGDSVADGIGVGTLDTAGTADGDSVATAGGDATVFTTGTATADSATVCVGDSLVLSNGAGSATGDSVATAGGGGNVYSFNMTAGNFVGFIIGYSSVSPAFGSIDQQPVPGFTLRNFQKIGANDTISFTGDATGLLTTLQVYVDSVLYPFDAAWTLASGNTQGSWGSSHGPQFVSGNTYFVEIK